MLVAGSKSRNRAVHGDIVAVELLPRVEWRGKVTALSEGLADERSGDDDEIKPMPTGGGRGSAGLCGSMQVLTSDPGRSRRGDPAEELEGLRGDLSPPGRGADPEPGHPARPGRSLGPPDPQGPDQHPAGRRAAGPVRLQNQKISARYACYHGDKTFYSGLILVLIPDLNLGSVLDLLLFLLQYNKK